jgi:hypothetical protein
MSKGFIKNRTDNLVLVDCPKCTNQFLVADYISHRFFTCVKCGSEWGGDYMYKTLYKVEGDKE